MVFVALEKYRYSTQVPTSILYHISSYIIQKKSMEGFYFYILIMGLIFMKLITFSYF